MKKRILAALLPGAMLLSLAACGGKNNGGSSSSGAGGSSSQTDASTGGSSADASQPGDASQPDEVTLTLNKNEITLNKAGGTFQLKYTTDPEIDAVPTYTSSDETVVSVDQDGVITAVAPGSTTVMVECGGAVVSAVVTCDWEEDTSKPSDTTKPSDNKPSGDASKPANDTPAPASNVDLSDFYSTVTGNYQFSFMMEADADMLNNYYAGLSSLSLSQQVVYLCGMSPAANGDFTLVQVSDSKDADTVKSILQARIDYMVGDGNGPGGAFYPMEQTMWEENARIVSNGSYVMLIVHENCDDIVKDFNALF